MKRIPAILGNFITYHLPESAVVMFVNRNRGAPKPSNRGSVGTARSAINRLARAAQERQVNSLAVQGYPCEYYSYKRLGTVCTCSTLPTTVETPTTPGVHVLDVEGNASPNHIQAMLQGSAISINRYGTRMQGQGLPDDYVEERTVPNRPLHQSQEQYNKTTDAGDGFAEQLEPDDDLDSLLDINGDNAGSTYLSTAGTSGCGVCLGTGFVGGYNYVNGLRIVYDTQHPALTNGFVIDQSTAPHTWKQITGNAQAQIFAVIPRGLKAVRALRLWNNKTRLVNYRLFVKNAANVWINADAAAIRAIADGQLHAFLINSIPGSTETLVFTHLEFVFDLNLNPVYIEWNRITESENPRLPENMEPVSIVISPTVPNVKLYDVIIDSTYDRVWKITTVTNFKDRQSRPHSWEAMARLIQSFEYPQLLANSVLLHRHAEYGNPLVHPVENENWSGHEDQSTL